VRLCDLAHLNTVHYHCYGRLGRVLWVCTWPLISSATVQGCRPSTLCSSETLCGLFRCIVLRRLLGSLVNAAVLLGSLGSVGMAGMTHKGSPDPHLFGGMAIAAFWVAIVGRSRILQTRYCHLDLLLGPHGLAPFSFMLRLTKGDCSFSMCASQGSTRIVQVPTTILEPTNQRPRLEE
jgi:hypothetical protein